VPYLIVADVQNNGIVRRVRVLRAALVRALCRRAEAGRIVGTRDQHIAGVLMWVPGSLAFLCRCSGLACDCYMGRSPAGSRRSRARSAANLAGSGRLAYCPWVSIARHSSAATGCQAASPRRFDLLRVPLVGGFLSGVHARIALQLPLLMLAGIMIWDGLGGPQIGPMNLAGVLPWIHWRGLLVFGLLVAGNAFCLACPFTLVRSLGRRLLPAAAAWPRRLRSKWLAVGLMLLFLWSYEAFALWDSPWWTAWIAVAYFVAALLVDGLFAGAAFCKYVCPIGQFISSNRSFRRWRCRSRAGRLRLLPDARLPARGPGNSGCELQLFQPRKVGKHGLHLLSGLRACLPA